MLRLAATSLCVVLAFMPAVTAGKSPSELFEQTILPIAKSQDRSSCVQCHLAAVDLKDYILPSNEKTFASLRDQGLIDPDDPDKSKILTFIRKGDNDPDKDARLAHEKTRRAEEKALAACGLTPVVKMPRFAKPPSSTLTTTLSRSGRRR